MESIIAELVGAIAHDLLHTYSFQTYPREEDDVFDMLSTDGTLITFAPVPTEHEQDGYHNSTFTRPVGDKYELIVWIVVQFFPATCEFGWPVIFQGALRSADLEHEFETTVIRSLEDWNQLRNGALVQCIERTDEFLET